MFITIYLAVKKEKRSSRSRTGYKNGGFSQKSSSFNLSQGFFSWPVQYFSIIGIARSVTRTIPCPFAVVPFTFTTEMRASCIYDMQGSLLIFIGACPFSVKHDNGTFIIL